MFEPDDFKGRPYGAGTNQGMHLDFGAALVGMFTYVFALPWAMVATGVVIIGWEAHQRFYRGATRADYIADVCYWTTGAALWSWLLYTGLVTGIAALAPCAPLIAFMIEYVRIKWLAS